MKKVPLNWLQAFEAAGRTGSFKAAAQELNVSPSNISHQIRDLERYLGTLLFSRNGRQVTLTEEGQNFLPELTLGFQNLRNATPDAGTTTNRLHIGAFPFLANEIITPGINTLKRALPDTEIRIFTHNDLQALTHVDPTQRLDVVIRYGPSTGRFPGHTAVKLADLALVPVVGPGVPAVRNAEALLSQPLIHVIGPFQGWQRWQTRYAPSARLSFALETDSFHAAMLAVSRNEGASLAVMPYLASWIRQQKVKAIESLSLPIEDHATFAVCAPYQQSNPRIAQFVDWLAERLR